MRVPGSNLLNVATRLISKQTFGYKAFISRAANSVGIDVTTYAPITYLKGSVQSVPRELFERYGLDFQKNYMLFYVSKSLLDVERDISGDQFTYNSKLFQALSKTDWYGQDGWVGLIAVQVPT